MKVLDKLAVFRVKIQILPDHASKVIHKYQALQVLNVHGGHNIDSSISERLYTIPSFCDRTGIPLTIALVDLDDFKQVNDRDGHAAGDRLLVAMTRTWNEELQPGDIFARLGGDEFLVVLVGSGEEEATRFFERLLFISPAPWSAGVIKRHADEDLSACLARADNTLYEAKRSRRGPREPVEPAPSREFHLEPSR
jgi:GGDEF domain-containing protein